MRNNWKSTDSVNEIVLDSIKGGFDNHLIGYRFIGDIIWKLKLQLFLHNPYIFLDKKGNHTRQLTIFVVISIFQNAIVVSLWPGQSRWISIFECPN